MFVYRKEESTEREKKSRQDMKGLFTFCDLSIPSSFLSLSLSLSLSLFSGVAGVIVVAAGLAVGTKSVVVAAAVARKSPSLHRPLLLSQTIRPENHAPDLELLETQKTAHFHELPPPQSLFTLFLFLSLCIYFIQTKFINSLFSQQIDFCL